MTRICVDTTLLVAASEAHRKNTESVRSNADEVGAVVRSLDWEIAAKQQYDKRIIRLQAELLRQARLLERHAAFLSFAESKYQMAELRVNGLSGLKVTVDGLLGALGDLITATFGGIVGVRILDFSRVLATQGLFVAVTSLVGWVLSPTTVDRGEIEEHLMDDYLKESLGKLHERPGFDQASWDKADLEGRKKMLASIAAEAAALYGVSGKAEFFNEPPFFVWDSYTAGYNDGSGTIHLNEYSIMKNGYAEALDTVFHELRHQYQFDTVNNPDAYLVDDRTREVWKNNWKPENYVRWEVDKAGYRAQPIEVDARDLGEAATT